MVTSSVSALGYLIPIFAFLLVFIVVYSLLVKTSILGPSQTVMLLVSFILAAFFVLEVRLIEFVQFSSAWFSVIIVGLFFLLLLLSFLPWKEPLAFLVKGGWFSWVILGLMIVFFVIISAYVFNWAVNWTLLVDWLKGEFAGMILLLIIAAVVAAVISWKIK